MPQPSNRNSLVEGAIRCLHTLPPEAITARVIATESGANLASIGYHFGSKDSLLSEAMIVSFRRWTDEVIANVEAVPGTDIHAKLARATDAVLSTMAEHIGLIRAFYAAASRAPSDESLREPLAEVYRSLRPAIATAFGLGEDQVAIDAAGIVMAVFDGLLVQAFLESGPAPDLDRLTAASHRLFPPHNT